MGKTFDTIHEVLADWPVGTLIGIVFILLLIAVVVLIAWGSAAGIYHLIDFAGRPVSSRQGAVTRKTFQPAYTQILLVFNAATKTSLPTPILHPDRWTLEIDLGFGRDTFDVSCDFFHQVGVGSQVVASYRIGRRSHSLNIQSVRL